MELITIPDVELCSAGMDWPSAGGLVTLTLDHIADCVAAFSDPHIVPPRLKIGHTDPRFADPDDPGHDPYYDGEPAIGIIQNARLTNDGATATGDYLTLKWLAEVSPVCYPSRSIEGAYEWQEGPGGKMEARWDVTTPGRKHYSFVLTACAMLGIQRPAVQDLDDLRYFLTEGGGVEVTGDATLAEEAEPGGVAFAVSMAGVNVPNFSGSGAPTLEASVDKVVDAFYSEFAVDDKYWWWVRDVRMDPNALVIDDDEGSLYLLPITSDDDQEVTFGDPERVLQTFKPAPAAAAAIMAAASGRVADGRVVKAFAAREQSAPEDRKEHTSQGGVDKPASISAMNFSELSDTARRRLCKSLSLSEDASDAQIEEALNTPEGEGDPAAGSGNGAGEGGSGDGGEGDGEGAEDEGGESGSEGVEAGESPTVPVDKTVLANLTADAKAGREARNQQIADARSAILSEALRTGKITPASKAAWDTKLKAAFSETKAELEALPEGLVPVPESEVGHGGDTGGVDTTVSLDMSEEEVLFPQLRGRAARES